tara:strand:- start:652 stop:876 length:225 start_codon:yes stop_codon:yes gene_type:complete
MSAVKIEDIYEEMIDGKIDTYECVIIAKELIAEVRRLRKGIWDATYLFQEAGNPKMSDKKRLETICEFLVELIE